jgi:ABC-type molybdate transport system substrate-binding protein
MRKLKRQIALTLFGSLLAFTACAGGGSVHMAVSPSIQAPMNRLCQLFSQKTSYDCKITSAPTGHLYAHVMHGIAYDLFVSSDEVYTQGLMNAHKAEGSGNFVLAIGQAKLGLASFSQPRAQTNTPSNPNPKLVLHEVIVLKDRQHEKATTAFVDFLHHQDACEIIQEAGFRCSDQIRLNA